MALHFIHLDRQPPTERARIALPFALHIHRHQVIEAEQLSQLIGRDVVLVGIDEVLMSNLDRSVSPGARFQVRRAPLM